MCMTINEPLCLHPLKRHYASQREALNVLGRIRKEQYGAVSIRNLQVYQCSCLGYCIGHKPREERR